MKIAIAAILAGAALSLAACHAKTDEATANIVVDNGADLRAAGSEGFGNDEIAGNAFPGNGAEAANVNEIATNAN